VFEWIAALGLGYLVVCYVLAKAYVRPMRSVPTRIAALNEVMVPEGKDGPDPAWCSPGLLSSHPSQVVFVFAHGYGGTRSSNEGLMLQLAKHGIDSVAPCMPGQDASPQPMVGFGVREAATMVAAANWVRQRVPKAKIVYAGVSMGGSASWLASELDPAAAGVISEGAYARFDEAMRNWFERKATGASIYLRPVVWMASAMAGINPSKVIPLNAAIKWKGRPALVIQAGDDDLIDLSQAQRLSVASGAPLWVVPGAVHANCYGTANTEYLDRVLAFVKGLGS